VSEHIPDYEHPHTMQYLHKTIQPKSWVFKIRIPEAVSVS